MKLWKLMLTVALVALVVLALASCGCEHTYDEAISKAPTCTEEGEKTLTCSQCGDVYKEAVAATGHTYTEAVIAPTCTEEGYTTYTCACGNTYKDNTVAATGHSYTETVTAPTCVAEGYTTHTCACGDTYTDSTVAATGVHTYENGIAELTADQREAYPNALGVKAEICTGCGDAKTSNDIVLINLDFETEESDFAPYLENSMGVAPFVSGAKYSSGLIQGGIWFNTTGDQVLFDDEVRLLEYEEFTVSFDFLLSEETPEGPEYIFAYGAAGEKATVHHFGLVLGEDGKLNYYKNFTERTDMSALLESYTIEDRTAWYHIDITVRFADVEVTVALGKYTDDTRTELADYTVVGTCKDSAFQSAGIRTHEIFRISYKNGGLAAMDNFMATVPAK